MVRHLQSRTHCAPFHKLKCPTWAIWQFVLRIKTTQYNDVKLHYISLVHSSNIFLFPFFVQKEIQQIMMIRIRNVLQFGRISRLVFGVLQSRFRYLPVVLNNAKQNYSHNFMGISSQLANFSTSVSPEPISVTVANNVKLECVELKWTGKESYQYPYLWLRDNCQCASCYNASSKSRRLLMKDLNPKSVPGEIKVSMFFLILTLLTQGGIFTFEQLFDFWQYSPSLWLITAHFTNEMEASDKPVSLGNSELLTIKYFWLIYALPSDRKRQYFQSHICLYIWLNYLDSCS